MALLKTAQVEKITKLPRLKIYELERLGKFPKSVRFGMGCTGWRANDIKQWMKNK